MPTSRQIFMIIALICITALGSAAFLQLKMHMDPCPLCIIQRYAFLALLMVSCAGIFTKGIVRTISHLICVGIAVLGMLAAQMHMDVLSRQEVSCGQDVLEGPLNALWPAKILPSFFRSLEFCDTPYPPILGFNIPEWSFAVLTLVCLLALAMREIRPGCAPTVNSLK